MSYKIQKALNKHMAPSERTEVAFSWLRILFTAIVSVCLLFSSSFPIKASAISENAVFRAAMESFCGDHRLLSEFALGTETPHSAYYDCQQCCIDLPIVSGMSVTWFAVALKRCDEIIWSGFAFFSLNFRPRARAPPFFT